MLNEVFHRLGKKFCGRPTSGTHKAKMPVGALFNVWVLKFFLEKVITGGKNVSAAQITSTTVISCLHTALIQSIHFFLCSNFLWLLRCSGTGFICV
jgi:hypothetical protein